MKTASFLAISALMIFAPFCPLLADGVSEPCERDAEIARTDGLFPQAPQIIPPAPETGKDPAPLSLEGVKTAPPAQGILTQPASKEIKVKERTKRQDRIEEHARRKEAGKKAKEDAMLKAHEDSMAKAAERAKLEEEFEQKRLADAQRKEKLYKKIDEIEQERSVEYRQKKGMRDKAPVSAERSFFETVPGDVAELIGKGGEYYNNKDYDKAREYYDKARFLAEEKKRKK